MNKLACIGCRGRDVAGPQGCRDRRLLPARRYRALIGRPRRCSPTSTAPAPLRRRFTGAEPAATAPACVRWAISGRCRRWRSGLATRPNRRASSCWSSTVRASRSRAAPTFWPPGAGRKFRQSCRRFSGMLAGFVDLAGPGMYRAGPWAPFVGAGIGIVRTQTGRTAMTFPATTTIVPGGNRTGLAWMATAGVSVTLDERVSLDLAWRYTDLGEIRTRRGPGRVIWRDGPASRCRSISLRRSPGSRCRGSGCRCVTPSEENGRSEYDALAATLPLVRFAGISRRTMRHAASSQGEPTDLRGQDFNSAQCGSAGRANLNAPGNACGGRGESVGRGRKSRLLISESPERWIGAV